MKPSTLPLELVLEIVSRLSLVDILNLTRLSSEWREFCVSRRELWTTLTCNELSLVPLPLGETLQSMPLPDLIHLSAKYSSLQERLKDSESEDLRPRTSRCFELTWLYSLDHWDMWLANLHQLTVFPAVLPGGEFFILRSKHALGIYTIAPDKSWGYVLDIQDEICDVVWHRDSNGWIRLLVLLEGEDRGYALLSPSSFALTYEEIFCRFINIYTIQKTKAGTMKAVRSAQVLLPSEGSFHALKLKNNITLAIHGTGVILYEHDRSCGVWLTVNNDKVRVVSFNVNLP
jgi:hypothetical protein